MSEVKGDRTGARVPGSGTSGVPVYSCETCRDSGVVHQREIQLPGECTINDQPMFARFYVTKPCPKCDGKPRLAGELTDAA
jgi:hypothetical protein